MTGREFLCTIHREFYRQLPEEFRVVKNPETGRESLVIPGELRKEFVTPKCDVRLGFPIHAAGWFFPDLYPTLSR